MAGTFRCGYPPGAAAMAAYLPQRRFVFTGVSRKFLDTPVKDLGTSVKRSFRAGYRQRAVGMALAVRNGYLQGAAPMAP